MDSSPNGSPAAGKAKIWIDLENTPHIPFFSPIIRELEARGYSVVLTARDAFQTCELADKYGLPVRKIGRHYGRNRIMKVFGLFFRACQLLPVALREKPTLGLNHGSRTQMLACNLLGIPTVMVMDYEHSKTTAISRSTWEIVPDVVSVDNRLHCSTKEKIRHYSGIKEDVYVPAFRPDPSILRTLGLNGEVIVTVRPPATEAHYHNPEAEALFERVMERMRAHPNTRVVLLPRNKRQEQEIRSGHPDWFADDRVLIPKEAVDGLNLLWHSDLVVSGGGTMNREAAALGVPVYSIFRGPTGAVDRSLQAQGRLVMIENVEQVDRRIIIQRRSKDTLPDRSKMTALNDIVAHLSDIVAIEQSATRSH